MKLVFPGAGVIRVESAQLFAAPDGEACKRFLQAALQLPAIDAAILTPVKAPTNTPCVDLCFDVTRHQRKSVLEGLASLLSGDVAERRKSLVISPSVAARDQHGVVRYRRYAGRVTGWHVERERMGSRRLNNPVLFRKGALCEAIERELMSVLGVNRYDTSAVKCRVDIEYDPRQLNASQLIEILDSALLPISALLFAYTAVPSFKSAWKVVTKERRLGVDVLDSIVVLACLATGQVVAGAILTWCLSFGRALVRRTEDNSKKLLLGAFGKQPRFVWMLKDGVEIQVSLDKLEKGDIVMVHTGEVVPVDGLIVEGLAMIDQQALTGESTPAEKGVGDQVFASTIMVAGKVQIAVERSGGDTATAKIAQILNNTAGYTLASQHKGEQLADQVVIPTLAVGALAFATIGPQGAAAVLNSDMGTGIRMAAPLAMLSTLALCAQRGVLVKDGRALDLLCEIDTVLFDKTGTLTRERPEIGRILASNGHAELQILRYAAAAERKFHHPIALAILEKANEAESDRDCGLRAFRLRRHESLADARGDGTHARCHRLDAQRGGRP
jgi:cation transport ATPase